MLSHFHQLLIVFSSQTKIQKENKHKSQIIFLPHAKCFVPTLTYSHLNLFVLFPISQICPLEVQYCGLAD